MYLRSITLEGYRSVPRSSPLKMDKLGRFNILIGPNNSGKSTVLRFLQVVASIVVKNASMPIKIPWDQADSSWWWQSETKQPIRAELIFETPAPQHDLDPKDPGRFEHDSEWRITITIAEHAKTNQCTVLVAPNVYIGNAWHPVVRNTGGGIADFENLNRTGEYVSSSSTDACPYHSGAASIVGQWAKGTRFYDPVRAIDREAGRRGLADGSDLLKKLKDQQLNMKQAAAFEAFRGRLIEELNTLLVERSAENPIEHFEIKGDEKLDLYVKRRSDRAPIALQYMGTGIAELTILLADFLHNEYVKQYFVEEPECHLHPGLLRRLMERLRSLSSAQFFITSHSNAVLDSTRKEDSIYRFSISPTSGTSVQRCSDLIEQSIVLDGLGVSGSTLLQTNCIIWVEGPSDRIYLKVWLERVEARLRLSHVEGSDYSFVYYGGKILSHFALVAGGQDKLVEMIRICRYSAVFMDKDTDPGDPTDEVRDTKKRIETEAQGDRIHRRAIFSLGREIENDIDPLVFRKAVSKLLVIDEQLLLDFRLSGAKRYPEEIIEHLGLKNNEAAKALRKLKDKVTLAELVAAEWTETSQTPNYCEELVRFVEQSRLA
jgi:predicted ATP-dependent endonuclease of OLD family